MASDFENLDFKSDELLGRLSIPTIVSKQGSRIVYQLSLRFRQITSLFDHMPMKSSKKDESYDQVDLTVLRNRYVRADKVHEIVDYVSDNIDTYVLPPISAVSNRMYSFHPYNQKEIIEKLGEGFDLVENPHRIPEALDHFDGMLQGLIIVKESEFNIEIMDGNHRCAAIHELSTMGREYKDLRIGVQIFYENDSDRQRQAFVDLNTSTPIDKTLLTLFGNRDPLSVAAKETFGTNPDYVIDEFMPESPYYIGFDRVNDSVNKNSTAVLSLNILKNMLIRFALGEGGTNKKFAKEFHPKSENYHHLLKDFSEYLRSVFEAVAPFNKIKQVGIQSVPGFREKYVSMTGAGLYLIALVGHNARKKKLDLEEAARRVAVLDWQREIETPIGKEYNSLFRTGVLNENGNISNNRNAQKSTLKALLEKLGME